MRIFLATSIAVYRFNGKILTKFAFASIIQRYKEVFGRFVLGCPMRDVDAFPKDFIDISDYLVDLLPLTDFESLNRLKSSQLREAIRDCDIVLGRFPSFQATEASRVARTMKKKVFAEVMGCAWDAYWNHGLIGKIVAPYVCFGTKHALKRADYALYVTESFLQKRYPCLNPTVGVSDVVIENVTDEIREKRLQKIKAFDKKNLVLATCAAVDVWYKGQHYVIRAIPKWNAAGIRVKYYCVGQGDQTFLRNVAKKYGVEDQVIFTGPVSHDEVFNILDGCDIYAQPSLTEGLPRALVEAMSRGCPCVGSKIGGIPELLPDECVAARKSVDQIAQKILAMIDGGLEKYAKQSFKRAKDFEKEILDERRNAYFNRILSLEKTTN